MGCICIGYGSKKEQFHAEFTKSAPQRQPRGAKAQRHKEGKTGRCQKQEDRGVKKGRDKDTEAGKG
jgi:hypothetical protein